MDPSRIQRLFEIEEAAQALAGSCVGGAGGAERTPAQGASLVKTLERELCHRYPGESPDLLRRVAEAQVWGRRRRRRLELSPSAPGPRLGWVLLGGTAAAALLALGLFLLLRG